MKLTQNYQDIFNQRGHLYNAASSICPTARDNELLTLLQLLEITDHDQLCDAPAGGGFVAEGIRRLNFSNCTITCVEPAERFAAAIPTVFSTHVCPIDQTQLPANRFTIVTSLAGLHHVQDRNGIFKEWRRLLKKAGQCVVADVGSDTATGFFLNSFVDRYCPGGHKGFFFEPGEFTSLFTAHNFKTVSEQLQTVAWRFNNRSEMGTFCKNLFGLEEVTAEYVARGLEEIVGTQEGDHGQIDLQWQLRYAKGIAQ